MLSYEDSDSRLSTSSNDYYNTIKLIVIGDCNVGKTTLMRKFLDENIETPSPTLNIETFNKQEYILGRYYDIQIMDTCGQERYRSFYTMFYKQIHGIVLIFDLTDLNSFSNLEHWIDDVKNFSRDVPIGVIGNKCDLQNRKVDKGMIEKFEKKNGLKVEEASGITGEGVYCAFVDISKKGVGKMREMQKEKDDAQSFKLNEMEGNGHRSCCF